MQYLVRQSLFSMGGNFTIDDAHGTPVLWVRGAIFGLGRKLDLLDAGGAVIVRIQQRAVSVQHTYEISHDGRPVCEVRKDLSNPFGSHFSVRGAGAEYDVRGDGSSWNYAISVRGTLVATIGAPPSRGGSAFVVDMAPDQNVPLILAIAIAIDAIGHAEG